LTFHFKNDDAPDLKDQLLDNALGLREAAFIDTVIPQPDNRYVIKGYSIIKENESTNTNTNSKRPPRLSISFFPASPQGLESVRVHDVYLDLFFIDPALANIPGPLNKNHKNTVMIFNPYENDRVELLQKSNAYGGSFVYNINHVESYELYNIPRRQIEEELEPPPSFEQKEAILAASHTILVGEVQDADSFGTAPVSTMLDKARLNGDFHPRLDDPVWAGQICQSYNCSLCNHINYRERRLEEEGQRLSGTFLLGKPAFSAQSLNRDEYNYLKNDILSPLEMLESSMSLASLQATSDMEYLKALEKELHNNDDSPKEVREEEGEE
jgi:hypothetical protein